MKNINIYDPESIRRDFKQVKAAICYIINDKKALMIKRKKEPFLGYIVAPGGKFEDGESPDECITREIFEETGLKIKNCKLKVVTSELGPKNYNWILYIFFCSEFEGTVKESDEGELCWIDVDKLSCSNMSDIDKRLLPYVMDDNKYFMKLRYDEEKNCTIEEIEVI